MVQLIFMRSFENRVALAEVLDNVHRQTVAEALGGLGVQLVHASWDEIEVALSEQKPTLPEGTFLSEVEYFNEDPMALGGTIPVGSLFNEDYVLTKSGRRPSVDMGSDSVGLGVDKYRRRIELFAASNNTYPDFTSIYLIPDTPPIAVHADALIELHADAWGRGEVIPETEIIEKIQKELGPKGVRYISEEMAKRVMYALRNDMKRLYNTDLFHHGG
jgi:hypothetical protein